MLDVSVAISRPVRNPSDLVSNFYHWTLHVHDLATSKHLQYQVAGEANYLVANILHTAPDERCIQNILVGRVDTASSSLLDSPVRKVELQNDIYSWDCQDYVIEIIDAMEDAGLLGSLDNYMAIKSRIKQMRGTIEETSQLVRRYDPSMLTVTDDVTDSDADEKSEDALPQHVCSEELVVDSDDEHL
ncbi:hypothetical protein LTR09_003462 [Extremus antarcticus]|uniref:Uncharacterized protein n=1 Tax=Extremus antarcticus TaxID=702011 RepID=A0AAJ0DRH4_9PEZI|nr:hypothetical protein LTR09_003462 [Extremus antarcticus]